MASSSKKPSDSRRVKIDELRAQQKAAERKRSFIFLGVAIVLGLVIVAAAAIPLIQRNADRSRDIASIGVEAESAGCGEVIDDDAEGVGDHVGNGTVAADVTRVEYETAPPSSGQHFATTAGFERHFYSRSDMPVLEELVHNLEHGYTIVWYDEDVADADVETLETLATRIAVDTPKFIVTAWDSEDRGEFPEGDIAISHWTTGTGHRLYCDRPSGSVIEDFIEQYPYTDSPEPNTA